MPNDNIPKSLKKYMPQKAKAPDFLVTSMRFDVELVSMIEDLTELLGVSRTELVRMLIMKQWDEVFE